ncbi:hypothetical protein [Bacillus haynesii]|uniref:hypothetical protein n=1 Tax=Bacillus haynesii TaxID=1925021 RepID=UPI00398B9D4A
MYSTTDRKGCRSYHSNPETCSACPLLEHCTRSKNRQKVITWHVREDRKIVCPLQGKRNPG